MKEQNGWEDLKPGPKKTTTKKQNKKNTRSETKLKESYIPFHWEQHSRAQTHDRNNFR